MGDDGVPVVTLIGDLFQNWVYNHVSMCVGTRRLGWGCGWEWWQGSWGVRWQG